MNEFFIICCRTFLGYFMLLILLKIMGKREVGQLSIFDLLIFLSIADIMVIGIENFDENIFYVIIPALTLMIIQKSLAFLILKNNFIRYIVDGKESLIVNDGIIDIKEMKKQCYNYDDLFAQLRSLSISSIEEVQYAILENSGRLSVITYENNKQDIFPLPIIVSGKVNKNNLRYLNLEKNTIENIIKDKKILISEIEFAFLVNKKELLIYNKKEKASTSKLK